MEVEGSDVWVGEDEGVGVGEVVRAEQGAEVGEAVEANEDRVGAGAEGNFNAREHGVED